MDGAGLPPGPGSWIGATMAYMRDPLGAMQRLRARHGDPFTMRLGPARIVIASAAADIRGIFTAPPESFVASGMALGEMVGRKSVLTLEGEAHHALRRTLNAAILDRREDLSGGAIVAMARRHVAGWPRGRAFAAMPLLARLSLEAIVRAMFGVAEESRIETFARGFEALTRAGSMLLILVPALRRDLGRWSPWGRFLHARGALEAMIAEEIAAVRAAGPAAARPGALARLVWLVDDAGGPALDDETIGQNMVALLSAGHLSTAAAMAWAIHWTWSTPGVLERLQAELRGFSPEDDTAYLDAVCREALRLSPVAPMVARELGRPMRVGGCLAPAGVMVGASIDLAHHDAVTFPSPEAFRPERFLDRRHQTGEYLPFGGGRRHCLGAWLAMEEMRLVLAVLATGPRLRLVSMARPKRQFSGGLLVPKGGVKIVIEGETP